MCEVGLKANNSLNTVQGSSCLDGSGTESNNSDDVSEMHVISTQQKETLCTYVSDILRDLTVQCSSIQATLRNITEKFNNENVVTEKHAARVISQSRKVIKKLINNCDNYETNLVCFYKIWKKKNIPTEIFKDNKDKGNNISIQPSKREEETKCCNVIVQNDEDCTSKYEQLDNVVSDECDFSNNSIESSLLSSNKKNTKYEKEKYLDSKSDFEENDMIGNISNKKIAEEIAKKKLLESDSDDLIETNSFEDIDSYQLIRKKRKDKNVIRPCSVTLVRCSTDKNRNEEVYNQSKSSSSDSVDTINTIDNDKKFICLNSASSSSSDISILSSKEFVTSHELLNDHEGSKSNEDETIFSNFCLDRKCYYKNDEKLKMLCYVLIPKLSEEILSNYQDALQNSRKYLRDKRLKRLIKLTNLEKKCKAKKVQRFSRYTDILKSLRGMKGFSTKKEEESLLDHFKKLENNEYSAQNVGNALETDFDANISRISTIIPEDSIMSDKELMLKADETAKKLLLHSSDSDTEQGKTMSDNSSDSTSDKGEKASTKKNISTKVNEEKPAESDEEKIKREDQAKWKRDKLLTLKFFNNSSDTDEDLHLESSKKNENCRDITDAKSIKRQRKYRRRILDSNSDVSDNDTTCNVSERKKSEHSSSDSHSSNSEQEAPPKRRRVKKMVSSDSEGDYDETVSSQNTPSKSGRKNIRKVLKDKQVREDTKLAAKEEEERLKRIAERQKLYNELYEIRLTNEKRIDKLVLDFDPETKKELVSVSKELLKHLKTHQVTGVKFMWDSCFESLKAINTTAGSGCVLAHCMGLGKTLQVITLSHTLLTHEGTNMKTILVVCPLSTVLNWVNEFKLWLQDVENADDIDIFHMGKCKNNVEKLYMLTRWHENGGVMIMGYQMFRTLTGSARNLRRKLKEQILKYLIDPGPDVIICDEGHLLKNEDTALSKCMAQVKTRRRIVLTGTPLQNNLIEYHCMLQFVKPNLLGTKKEFMNRFVHPITNGQFDNSTEYDVKLMKKRAHVLHKMLEGSVQRLDYSVLTPHLPPKQEYVIFVKLTDVQIQLYRHYLENIKGKRRSMAVGGALFSDFQELQRIWTHPVTMRLHSEQTEKINEKKFVSDSEGSLKDFVVDEESSDESSCSTSSSSSSDDSSSNKIDHNKDNQNDRESDSDIQLIDSPESTTQTDSKRRITRSSVNDKEDIMNHNDATSPDNREWWSQYVQPEQFDDMRISSKLLLLFGILKECETIGDKVLVFSQSLYSLTLIEYFLRMIDDATQENASTVDHLDGHAGSWMLGLDYFRLDGQTSPENRNIWCKIFNNCNNMRARLFLISTRAGGLGINLTAANRVILFDASWNPSHDVQSIFRVYRFGQKKPCYIYRFLASGTMEEKIYNRQVTKLSLSCRVVDEQQIERHYKHSDLAELYNFDPPTNTVETLNLPKDRLLAEILLKYKNYVHNYHEHDSLLENKTEEELNEEERKQAWLEYEEEKKGNLRFPPVTFAQNNAQFLEHYGIQYDQQPTNTQFYLDYRKLIEKDYPNASQEQLDSIMSRVMKGMYDYWEKHNTYNLSSNSTVTPQFVQYQVNPILSDALQNRSVRVIQVPNNTVSYPYDYNNPSTSKTQDKTGNVQIDMNSIMTTEAAPASRIYTTTTTITKNKGQEE